MPDQVVTDGRLTANRRLFLGTYTGLGFVSTFVYLSQVNLSFKTIVGSRLSGLAMMAIDLPAILPYLISGLYAWQLISERRLGLYLHLAVTIVGTAAASLVITGAFDIPMDLATVFWTALVQTTVYGLTAKFLLRVSWRGRRRYNFPS